MGVFLANLFTGILGSIIAAILIFITVTLRSKIVRHALTAVASTFLGIDVKYVFNTGKESQNSVQDAIRKSSKIKIFTGRGNEFQGDFYRPLFESGNKDIKILLPDIVNQPTGIDWTEYREKELSDFDHAFGEHLLKEQISSTYKFLFNYNKEKHLQLRCYDYPHIGRIIITDDFVFLTPYSSKTHGRQSRVFQYSRSDMYDFYERLFDMLWENSKECTL